MHNLPHIKKPDSDNLEKFLFDAMTGLLWDDDSRICWVLKSKSITKDNVGETLLAVTELDFLPPDFDKILKTIQNTLTFGEDL